MSCLLKIALQSITKLDTLKYKLLTFKIFNLKKINALNFCFTKNISDLS